MEDRETSLFLELLSLIALITSTEINIRGFYGLGEISANLLGKCEACVSAQAFAFHSAEGYRRFWLVKRSLR